MHQKSSRTAGPRRHDERQRGDPPSRRRIGPASLAATGALAIAAAALAFGAVLGPDGPLAPAIALLAGGRSLPATPETDRAAHYLVRSTLMALDDANRTGNYSVLRQLASPSFQAANSPERLAEVFAVQRERNLDLSVAALGQPRWTQPPAVGSDRLLRLVGRYALPGEALRFALAFEPVGGAWRLYEIHVLAEPEGQLAENATR